MRRKRRDKDRLSRSRLICRSYCYLDYSTNPFSSMYYMYGQRYIQMRQRKALKFTILHLPNCIIVNYLFVLDRIARKRCLIIIEPAHLTLLKMVACAVITKKRCIALTRKLMIMVVADSGRFLFRGIYLQIN